jgi:hypothetical protein
MCLSLWWLLVMAGVFQAEPIHDFKGNADMQVGAAGWLKSQGCFVTAEMSLSGGFATCWQHGSASQWGDL